MNFPSHTPVSTNQDDEMVITDEVDLPNKVVTDGNSNADEVVTPTEDFVKKSTEVWLYLGIYIGGTKGEV